MTIEERLFEKYSKIAYVSAEELFFDKNIAFDFIKQCNEWGVAIIGIEFFYVKNNKIIPVIPPNGIDSSDILEQNDNWKVIVQACNSFAFSILSKEFMNDSNQYCTFVTLEKAEWKN